ncbi:hypothetical protein DF044_01745 [Burkholderia contaminans]|uniref:hypothetical protein n=1 Tax=Burkholderia contaminans TaxID=488447 RepID=UPI000F5B046D|nr:hypothetical protein [Burkholderia contaminans]RQT19410.1 hypothetical protein DF044_01745 [Burkholderia contaminans]
MEVLVYRAESGKMRDVVDVALVVLLKVDINAFVDLKEKYLPHGLKQAIRMHDHPFWQDEGLRMWEEIKALVNARLDPGYWFGQSIETPAVVGIFRTESE